MTICTLGVDISTTGAKALIVSETGKVLASATRRILALHPTPAVERTEP